MRGASRLGGARWVGGRGWWARPSGNSSCGTGGTTASASPFTTATTATTTATTTAATTGWVVLLLQQVQLPLQLLTLHLQGELLLVVQKRIVNGPVIGCRPLPVLWRLGVLGWRFLLTRRRRAPGPCHYHGRLDLALSIRAPAAAATTATSTTAACNHTCGDCDTASPSTTTCRHFPPLGRWRPANRFLGILLFVPHFMPQVFLRCVPLGLGQPGGRGR